MSSLTTPVTLLSAVVATGAVCDVVNRMKSDLPMGQLYQWCSSILENHHGKVQKSCMG